MAKRKRRPGRVPAMRPKRLLGPIEHRAREMEHVTARLREWERLERRDDLTPDESTRRDLLRAELDAWCERNPVAPDVFEAELRRGRRADELAAEATAVRTLAEVARSKRPS